MWLLLLTATSTPPASPPVTFEGVGAGVIAIAGAIVALLQALGKHKATKEAKEAGLELTAIVRAVEEDLKETLDKLLRARDSEKPTETLLRARAMALKEVKNTVERRMVAEGLEEQFRPRVRRITKGDLPVYEEKEEKP